MSGAVRLPPPDRPRGPHGVPRLLCIVDVPTCVRRGVDPTAAVGLVADAGAPAVMLRARDLPAAELAVLADAAVRFCRYGGSLALVSAAVDVAVAADADGVHLPSSSIADAARALDAGLLVGASVHDHAELLAALDAGVHYVLAAPVFDPTSKPRERPPLGVDGLASLCRAAGDTPVVALGGVTPARIPAVRAAGAHGVAALGAFSHAGARDAVPEHLAALRRAAAVGAV